MLKHGLSVVQCHESGFYYLQSRYYDPRFINADGLIEIELTGSLNLFSYCINNPVQYSDPKGYLQVKGTDACGGGTTTGTPAVKTVSKNKTTFSNNTTSYKSNYSKIQGHDCGGIYGYTDTGTGMPVISNTPKQPWCTFENSSSFWGLRFSNDTPLRRAAWCGINSGFFVADVGFMYTTAVTTIAGFAGAPATAGASVVVAVEALTLFVECGVHIATDGASLVSSIAYLGCNSSFNSSIGIERGTLPAIEQIFIMGFISVD